MDGLKLEGFPKDEKERRDAWMALPRSVRLAIRRLHHNFGSHKPKSVMLRLLRAARVGPEMLRGAMLYRCEQCAELQKPQAVAPAALPAPYEFNHEVILDVFEEKDASGAIHQFLSIVDNGTTFHVVAHVGLGLGQPSSRKCLAKFLSRWVSWAASQPLGSSPPWSPARCPP